MKTSLYKIQLLLVLLFCSPALIAQSDLSKSKGKDLIKHDTLVSSKFKVSIGGQLKLNGIYDFNALQNHEAFNVPSIPTGSHEDETARFSMGIRQSRLKLGATYNSESVGPVNCFFEGDFFGQGTFNFRVRHFHLDIKSFRIGQSWSLFTDEDVWPDVIDFDGPPTGVWVRSAQVRYTKQLKEHIKWAFAIETPRPDIRQVADIDSTLTETYQGFPDLTTHINARGDWGHAQLALVYRRLNYKSNSKTLSSNAGGVALSGHLNLAQNDKFLFQAAAGTGIASYLVSFGGGGYDAIPAGDGSLQNLPIYGGYAAYEHWWQASKLKSTFVAGVTHLEADLDQFDRNRSTGKFYSGNLFWMIDENITTGVEAQYGNVEDFYYEKGDAARLQFMVLFNF
ncbi:MAG: hypothetical protein JEZ14_13005 [Marinilabiliaceae bacterium]|nr:hypothetical protein [Marinilabiliaceae bacterium]